MKKVFKALGLILALILLVVLIYVSYVLISYHRLGDMPLAPEGTATREAAQTQTVYSLVSYNIGFGAYEDDYGFFMDGGTESRAWSETRLDANLKDIADLLRQEGADFCFVQEVDIDSTRSYGFDERDYVESAFYGYDSVFAQNYDSPYLFYPVTCPHGASKSGIMTFSKAEITEAERVELPIESGLSKLLDLDRCYSKSRVKTDNGKELVLYNFHLSAYTSDGTIAIEQLKTLLADMEAEYQKGNYCIAGGDFNKDILGNSSAYFGKSNIEYTWAQPIPEDTFYNTHITLIAPLNSESGIPTPSCRNADSAYHEGQYVVTIDGFLVTDNVSALTSQVIDTTFAYSDHNPVKMSFVLED